MKLFGITSEEKFEQFSKTPFENEYQETILENWLEDNPNNIFEDSDLIIIGRQVSTNFNTYIDLLGVDRQGTLAVIELKRNRTPRETLAQALEYASFIEKLDIDQLEEIFRKYTNDESIKLAEYHKKYFELSADEAVAFNKSQKVVIIGQNISPEIRQTSNFLSNKGFQVICVEFSFFKSKTGMRILTNEIVAGNEPPKSPPTTESLPTVSKEKFIASLDQNGKTVFEAIINFAKSKSFPIHWGSKGFSLNVDYERKHIALFYCYPPGSVYKQSIYTDFFRKGSQLSRIIPHDDISTKLVPSIQTTGLFEPAGREFRCSINRTFSDDEIETLKLLIKKLADTVREYNVEIETI
jgi:hypothetical protein